MSSQVRVDFKDPRWAVYDDLNGQININLRDSPLLSKTFVHVEMTKDEAALLRQSLSIAMLDGGLVEPIRAIEAAIKKADKDKQLDQALAILQGLANAGWQLTRMKGEPDISEHTDQKN